MKVKKLLTLFLSLGLFVSFTDPVNAENSSKESNKAETVSSEICTKNPEYEARKKALDSAKTELDAAKKELKNAETDKANAETAVTDATTGVQNAQNALDSANGTAADAQNKLTDAENAKNEAQVNVSNAQTAKDAADANVNEKQNAYDATQDKSNPEWQKRQEAVDNAKTELDTAKEEKKAAETDKTNAETAVTDAEKDVTAKENDLKKANSALSNAQKNVDAAQAKLDEAKANQSQAQAGSDTASDAVTAAQAALDKANQAKADAESAKANAEKAHTDAQTAQDEAQKAYDAAKAAYDASVTKEANSAIGFYKSLGTDEGNEAVKMIEYYNKISEDWGKTEIGEQGDATTLENFLKALDYLEECNKLRAAEGLPELKVTTMAMAFSQANCNHSAVGGNHWRTPYVSEDGKRRYSGAENLSWGYGTTTPNEEGYEFRQDPYEGWYESEKSIYEFLKAKGWTVNEAKSDPEKAAQVYEACNIPKDPDWIQTGHYLNVVNSSYVITGFAVSDQSQYDEVSTHEQSFSSVIRDYETAYTVEEYRNMVLGYKTNLDSLLAKLNAAQAALDAAKANTDTTAEELGKAVAAVQQAEQDVKAKTEDLNSAKDNATVAAERLNAAKNATAQAQAERDAVNTDAEQAAVTAAENAKKAADQAVTDAKSKLEEKKQAVADAQAKIDEAEAKLEAAQSSLDELSAGAVEAKKALEEAKAEAEKADKALEDAQKAFGEKTDLYSEAEANKEAADKAVADAAATKEEADRKLADAQADLDEKTQTDVDAQTKLDKAEAKYEEAQDAFNAVGHSWKETIQKPTCTEDGAKVYTCENCGATKKETLPALGHDYSEKWTIDKEATYYEDGSKSHHCTRCDDITDVTVIPRLSFVDVNETTDHYDDILWLAANKVTAGWDVGNGQKEFRPYVDVARCDMAAFIRRLAVGNNWLDAATWTPSEEDWNTFTDIDADSPHAEDVLWLAHTGISEGWTEEDGTKTFRPLVTVARCDMAAFLQRLASKQGLSDASVWEPGEADWTFADIDTDSPHAEEVLWLAHSGVSKGWDEGNGTTTFRPYTAVARCDMAAFLRRLVG